MKHGNKIKTDILILGAGIAGYETFRTLKKYLRRYRLDKKITIVDKNNFFTFVPMLHEAATGSIEPAHAAIPLRELVHGSQHEFIKAAVKSVDPKKNVVKTNEHTISYDYVVIALGSSINFFGTKGAAEHAYHVRTLSSAMQLRHDFLKTLETCHDNTLTMNIVGGGYTGIEVAGQYCDLAHDDIKKLYPEKTININLFQGGKTILPHMSTRVQQRVHKKLAALNTNIVTGNYVSEVEPDGSIALKNGEKFPGDMCVWTAGFSNLGPTYIDNKYCHDDGRILVCNHLHLKEEPTCYAIGDIAHIKDPKHDIAYPQLAEAAHKEGKYVGRHIARTIAKKKTPSFVFRSKGTLMPVGDWWGVAEIGPFTLFGRLAWWIRRTVYLMFMPGIMRKLRIVIDWTLHGFGFRHFTNIDVEERL